MYKSNIMNDTLFKMNDAETLIVKVLSDNENIWYSKETLYNQILTNFKFADNEFHPIYFLFIWEKLLKNNIIRKRNNTIQINIKNNSVDIATTTPETDNYENSILVYTNKSYTDEISIETFYRELYSITTKDVTEQLENNNIEKTDFTINQLLIYFINEKETFYKSIFIDEFILSFLQDDHSAIKYECLLDLLIAQSPLIDKNILQNFISIYAPSLKKSTNITYINNACKNIITNNYSIFKTIITSSIVGLISILWYNIKQ